jgi:hypothetical protein
MDTESNFQGEKEMSITEKKLRVNLPHLLVITC